jgi:hypothetical protein
VDLVVGSLVGSVVSSKFDAAREALAADLRPCRPTSTKLETQTANVEGLERRLQHQGRHRRRHHRPEDRRHRRRGARPDGQGRGVQAPAGAEAWWTWSARATCRRTT